MSQDPPSLLAEKIGGLMLLLSGAAITKVSVVDPLLAASRGAGEITTAGIGVVLLPVIVALGAALLFRPHNTVWNLLSRPTLRDPETQRLTQRGWALLVVALLPGIALFAWLRWTLGRHGYHS